MTMNDDRCVVKRRGGERGAGLILEDGNWTGQEGKEKREIKRANRVNRRVTRGGRSRIKKRETIYEGTRVCVGGSVQMQCKQRNGKEWI